MGNKKKSEQLDCAKAGRCVCGHCTVQGLLKQLQAAKIPISRRAIIEHRAFEGTMMPFDSNVGWYVQGPIDARRNDAGVLNAALMFQWAIDKKVRVTVEVIKQRK